MNKNDKIFLAGHRGLVGSAILKNLKERGFLNIITKTHKELDLSNQQATADFFAKEKPDYVFLAAAKVGGIVANNTYRADFIYHNLMIQNNVVHESYINGVKKLLFLGSTCIYPKNAAQPIQENSLLTDVLEYTNEPYAIAKIAGIKLCESYNLQYNTNFISVMPTNLYGPNDNFDLEKSHVLPALIKKIHLAKLLEEGNNEAVVKELKVDNFEEAEIILSKFGISSKAIEIWGTGKPMREFLWSEDMADACVHIMQNVDFTDLIKDKKEVRNTHINIGTGNDIAIKDLANLIKEVVGFKGDFIFNSDKPDGTMRKVTDVSKLKKLGWQHSVKLEKGIQMMYDWYLKQPNG
ncbi:GDP-L-fucose synthase [Polaribacter pectinis]|uniref:GDP-L-fucose synthase n=1 Tax=Polaribacter pectinis TaxID=2738844 RepID=A0A7G9L980_9FLAO|nr:GDP-L-fucose synthase [Polaribacter pectinis]QNM85179.1 GDP-L-fucose synthase [Polaribacter pectinis]